MKHCPKCNSKLNKRQKFCPECGAPIPLEEVDAAKSSMIKVIIIVLGALLLIAVSISGFVIGLENKKGTTVSFSNNPEKITEAAKSVVKLNCYDSNGQLIASGSGFSAFTEGIIITNYHVIEDYPARIEIETEFGQKCDIFGGLSASAERDIAILYYKPNKEFSLPLLNVASTKMLTKGEKVVAIGSPLGLTNVVSTGVFSGYSNIGDFTDIQFTASISSGSSGGALFSDNGDVIGITYASLESGQNLNFAVPMEFVESLWKKAPSGATSLSGFYDSIIPHYSVGYVLENYEKLINTTFYLDCWYSSYGDSADGYVVFCGNGYEDIYNPNENDPQIRFSRDIERYIESDLIKIIGFGSGYWSERYVSILFGKRGQEESVKCSGTGWSSSDNKPYVIVLKD